MKTARSISLLALLVACGGSTPGLARTATATATVTATPTPTATAPVAATPRDLVIVPMSLTSLTPKASVELKQDGTVEIDHKPTLKFVGSELREIDGGRVLMTVKPDGTAEYMDALKLKFDEHDALVSPRGTKLIVDDDGVVRSRKRDGSEHSVAKLVGFTPAARRTACVLTFVSAILTSGPTGKNR
ncbi:MAG TPA: hypothetical protein VGH28_23630 [Polyangiaceae bacterium]|jgi:hypothetical protein